jgi:hypothetical protein
MSEHEPCEHPGEAAGVLARAMLAASTGRYVILAHDPLLNPDGGVSWASGPWPGTDALTRLDSLAAELAKDPETAGVRLTLAPWEDT